MDLIEKNMPALEEAIQKHLKARKCMRELKFETALGFLMDALHIKQKLVDVPPFVCISDIAALHLDIGNALRALGLDQAMKHYHIAWSLFRDQLGLDHPLTQDAQRQCILVTTHTLCTTAPAA